MGLKRVKHPWQSLLVIGGVAVALTGCLGGGGGDDSSGASITPISAFVDAQQVAIPAVPATATAAVKTSLLMSDPVPAQSTMTVKAGDFSGVARTWGEYIPKSYDGTKVVPLVVAVHGGSADEAWMYGATSWAQLADKQGFIVIFPRGSACDKNPDGSIKQKSGFNSCRWNAYPEFNHDPFMALTVDNGVDEAKFFKDLIEQTTKTYKIDTSRVYMHGQSNGGMMTTYFMLRYPEMLAAAAPCSAPPSIDIMGQYPIPTTKIPTYWWNGEKDTVKDQYNPENKVRSLLNLELTEFWAGINKLSLETKLRLDGPYNTKIFPGDAEVRSTEFRAGGHTLPYTASYIIWNDFFSRFARGKDGSIVLLTPEAAQSAPADKGAVALKLGVSFALVDGKVVRIGATAKQAPAEAGTGVLIPAQFAATAYGASLAYNGTTGVTITTSAGTARFTVGSATMLLNGKTTALDAPAKLVNGEIMVSLKAVAGELLGKSISYSGMNLATGQTMTSSFGATFFGGPTIGGTDRHDVYYVSDRAADLAGNIITYFDKMLGN